MRSTNQGRELAPDYVTLFESPDPQRIFGYSPGIARLDGGRLVATTGGRLIATIDVGGPGAAELRGPKYHDTTHDSFWQGRVYTSDDGGRTWSHRADFPFMHARPFAAGDAVYVLGQARDLMVISSHDGGLTWGEPVKLTEGQEWHQAPSNVHYANGSVYLVMERRTSFAITSWPVGELAPVLMRGRVEADLTIAGNWTFASELSFHDTIPDVENDPQIDLFGVPLYDCPYPRGTTPAPGRVCAPIGWLESNVVQFSDPGHIWHDPTGRTFHLWMRAHTGGPGFACIAKVTEQGEEPGTGPMETTLETVPSGKTMLYVPCPGGNIKFHVLYDEQTRLYWLLSNQATDSMTRPERLLPERHNLPHNQRRRLQLHFSKNMVDWCFAGIVTVGPAENAARSYASMAFDGDDLLILARSGDMRAKSAHDGNLITFHRICDFRDLATRQCIGSRVHAPTPGKTEHLRGLGGDADEPVLWGGAGLPNSAEVPLLDGVSFSLIKPHQPAVDGGNWILGVALARHKDKLYGSYGFNTDPEENTATEQARGRISTDGGETWEQDFVIDAGRGNLAVSHGVFHSHEGSLWAFQGAFYDNFQRTHTRAYLLDDKTDEWVAKGIVIDNGFWPMQQPLQMEDGNWIMSGVRVAHGLPAENHYPAVAISRSDDFTDWEMVVIPAEDELGRVWGESTVVVNGPTIVNVARYGGKPEKNRALVAVSQDFGRTWTPARRSNLTMTTSKPFTGTLSTGETYLIGTTTADCGARRTPLTIALSRPGEVQLQKVFAIRHGVFPDGPGPSSPAARLSYPYAIEHDGKLYVGYADKHHHTAELAVIPVAALRQAHTAL
jgi:hypothetical protein